MRSAYISRLGPGALAMRRSSISFCRQRAASSSRSVGSVGIRRLPFLRAGFPGGVRRRRRRQATRRGTKSNKKPALEPRDGARPSTGVLIRGETTSVIIVHDFRGSRRTCSLCQTTQTERTTASQSSSEYKNARRFTLQVGAFDVTSAAANSRGSAARF